MELFVIAIVVFFAALALNKGRLPSPRGLLLGQAQICVEDLLLDLRREAAPRAPEGMQVEVEWNRYLHSEQSRNAVVLEGFHVLILGRSPHIPPFLQLPGGWQQELLGELPVERRHIVVSRLQRHEVRVERGVVQALVELPPALEGRVNRDHAVKLEIELQRALQAVIDVAERLLPLEGVAPHWLAQRAAWREQGEESFEILSTLLEHYPRHAAAAGACARAIERGGDAERLLAALHTGAAGLLQACFLQAQPDQVPDGVFLRALERLRAGADAEQEHAALQHATAHPSPQVLARALSALRRLGQPLSAAQLGELAQRRPAPEVQHIVALELAEATDPAAEQVLMDVATRALQASEPRFEVVEQVFVALQRVGTARAIRFLRAFEDEDDDRALREMGLGELAVPAGVRAEAGLAIQAIRARLGPQQEGALALVAAVRGGELAVADGGGALAVATVEDKEPG